MAPRCWDVVCIHESWGSSRTGHTDISTSALLHRPLATRPPGGGEEPVGFVQCLGPWRPGSAEGPADTIFLINDGAPLPPHSCPHERPDSLVQQRLELRHWAFPPACLTHRTNSTHVRLLLPLTARTPWRSRVRHPMNWGFSRPSTGPNRCVPISPLPDGEP